MCREALTEDPKTRFGRTLALLPSIEGVEGVSKVSHFLMQYRVDKTQINAPRTGKEKPPPLSFASAYIVNHFLSEMSMADFLAGLVNLGRAFSGFNRQNPHLFEIMVVQMITRNYGKWKICSMPTVSPKQNTSEQTSASPKSKVPKPEPEWNDFVIPKLPKSQCFIPSATPKFGELETDILYFPPQGNNFPLVDMFYKETSDTITGIQVTFAEDHPTTPSKVQKFVELLELPKGTKIKVLIATRPENQAKYAEKDACSMIQLATGSTQSKEAVIEALNIAHLTPHRHSRPNLVALVLGWLRQAFTSSQHAISGGGLVRCLLRLWVLGPSTFSASMLTCLQQRSSQVWANQRPDRRLGITTRTALANLILPSEFGYTDNRAQPRSTTGIAVSHGDKRADEAIVLSSGQEMSAKVSFPSA